MILIGARGAGDPTLSVLGIAILTGVVWIQCGWAADDNTGLIHAITRELGCCSAFTLVEERYRASAMFLWVVVSYLYSLTFKRKGGALREHRSTTTAR